MDIYIILLRIAHVFSAVLWVGGGVLLFAFIEPAVAATAPAGNKFMQYLMVKERFSLFMGIVSIVTVLAGALLYWRDSAGLQLGWIATPPGVGFTLGAVIGIGTAVLGFARIRPIADRIGTLGAQIEAAGAPPSSAQVAELTVLDRTMRRLSKVDFVMLLLALLMMATARYW